MRALVPFRPLAFLSWALLLSLTACGSSTTKSLSPSSIDAGDAGDASDGSEAGEVPSDAPRELGPPMQHRSAQVACAPHAPPALPDGGTSVDGGPPPTECRTDDDCGANEACACNLSCDPAWPVGQASNVCVRGNCKTDSDCGNGGYCSLSNVPGWRSCTGFFKYATGYYCHTARDLCANDSDCAAMGEHYNFCLYAPAGPGGPRWECGGGP